ncbi:MAG: hypothetical protein U0989_02765 [Azonexus sp.]|nr:hypothetical protein [Azonexus sp.]MDZ4313689.1 hypothetical protein [Azonexus sp.]
MRFIILGLPAHQSTQQWSARAGSDVFSYRVAYLVKAKAMMKVLIKKQSRYFLLKGAT